jgi:transcriptional regulator with XRE-family HTH domain
VGIALNADRLRLELARRGWSHSDLARAAHVSPATVSAAAAGRRLSPATLRCIVTALSAAPPLAEIDNLLL